eukprot:UN12068
MFGSFHLKLYNLTDIFPLDYNVNPGVSSSFGTSAPGSQFSSPSSRRGR